MLDKKFSSPMDRAQSRLLGVKTSVSLGDAAKKATSRLSGGR
jgi:hypothetical protein